MASQREYGEVLVEGTMVTSSPEPLKIEGAKTQAEWQVSWTHRQQISGNIVVSESWNAIDAMAKE